MMNKFKSPLCEINEYMGMWLKHHYFCTGKNYYFLYVFQNLFSG